MKTVHQIRRENLDLLASELGSMDRVAALVETSAVYLSQLKKQSIDQKTGRPRQMGDKLARRLEKGCKKEEGWMDVDHARLAFDANVSTVRPGVREYPVISFVQAGSLKEISDPYGPGDGFATEAGDDDAGPWAFFLEIKGDSMLPEFKEGDRVRIDPDVRPNPGDYVVAKNSSKEATFKKYRARGIDMFGNEIFELIPLNENYASMRSDEHDLTVIGTMTEHRRRYRSNGK